ncbi:MAG: hypothetical protein AAF423_05940 [Pseudomonadota bacterium]
MKNLPAVAFATCVFACAFLNLAHAEEEEVISEETFEERFSGPAVSEINAKISVGHIAYNFNPIAIPLLPNPVPNETQDGVFVEASVSVPIGERFGFQLDGVYGDIDGDIDLGFEGVGGHLFWRDPAWALLGLYAHYKEYGDIIQTYQIAGEAEFYLDRWNFEFLAGADFVETEFGDDTFFVGEAVAAYYPTDNLRIAAGVRQSINTTALTVGAEVLFPTGKVAPSIFVDASFDDEDTQSVLSGVRLYLGGSDKSLIRRHREDDPKIRLDANSAALGSCYNNAQTHLFEELTTLTFNPPRSNGGFLSIEELIDFDDCRFTFNQ